MITETDRQEAFDAGVVSAKAQLARSNKPLLLMDEHCDDLCASANAMGWNSVCASDENKARWAAAAAFAVDPQQSIVTAIPQPVPAMQTVRIEPLSAERDTQEPAPPAGAEMMIASDTLTLILDAQTVAALLEYRRAQAAFDVLGHADPDEERGADLFIKAETAAERLGKLVAALAPADVA
ncbi:hypothetical protein [Pseudomonas aeruginosa]|uniref:hypothetical protein n=1 Tax=Pseudomonas aeruginosa TaxID=287 RepID=UPI00287F9718|nr:hypothetical protein [Pseudomonas aeruginosa]